MKRLFFIMLLVASTAQAQDAITLGGGYNEPLRSQQFIDTYGPGISLHAGVQAYANDRVSVGLELGLTLFPPDGQPDQVGNATFISFGSVVNYHILTDKWINPYVHAGYHLFNFRTSGVQFRLDGPNIDGNNYQHLTTMASAGAGIRTKHFGPIAIYIQGETSYAFTQIKSSMYANVRAGVVYRL